LRNKRKICCSKSALRNTSSARADVIVRYTTTQFMYSHRAHKEGGRRSVYLLYVSSWNQQQSKGCFSAI
jgi:hypothetical protein